MAKIKRKIYRPWWHIMGDTAMYVGLVACAVLLGLWIIYFVGILFFDMAAPLTLCG
jgi:hypothetical protein